MSPGNVKIGVMEVEKGSYCVTWETSSDYGQIPVRASDEKEAYSLAVAYLLEKIWEVSSLLTSFD